MTKSNKTLLCCLLTCVMALACALTILPIATPTTANAAETTTLDFSQQGYGNQDDVTELSIGDIKVKFSNAKYFDTGTSVRVYAKGTVEVTCSSNITSIVFTFGSGDKSNTITSDTGTYNSESKTWTGSAQSVVFTIGGTKDHRRIKSMTITSEGAKTIVPTINGTTIENASTVVNVDNKCDVYLAATNGYAVGKTYAIVLNNFVDKSTAFSVVVNGGEATILENDGTKEQMTLSGTFVEEGLNVVVSEYVVVACDHTELTFVDEVAATCTTTGVKEHYKCANVACGKLFDKNTDDKQEVTPASLTIAALDHQWNDGEITTAATCTTDGVKTFTCTREGCGETKTETIPALGHNYGTDGKCTVCGISAKIFKLVTDTKDLAEGDKIIIARNSKYKTIAGAMNNDFLTAIQFAEFSEDGKTVTVTDQVIEIFTLRKSDGFWTLTNQEGKMLGANNAKAVTWDGGSTTWRITFSGVEATIQNSTESYGRFLYNVNSPRFLNYTSNATSGMVLPEIYKLEEPEAAKQFTVTETVTAVENGSILNNGTMYILPNGQIDVVYNVTANSGINALEGTIAWNAELFDFVSMTAGNIFGENNVTVSGESATTKKIAVTIGASNNATGVLLTVRYQLKDGVTAEQLANAKFGFTADVLFGTDTTTKVANTATENTVPMSVRQDATLTVNGVDYTADDRTITLTYNGQDITAGTEEDSVLKIATNHTGYNADCLTWTVVKNAGNYVLKIAVAADGAYNAISEVSYTIVVKQVEIASTNIAITNNTTSKDLLGGNAKWTEADFTITYNGETLHDEFSGLYQIAIVNGEVAEAVAQHTLTVELTLTAQASVNYVLTGTDVAEGKLSKQFVVSVVNAAINIIGMPDNVERAYNAQAIDLSGVSVEEGATLKIYVALNGGEEVEVTENLNTYVKNVGNYVVRFEAHKNANVYSQTRTYTITKCDLAKVKLVYNGDTVTWTDTQTNGETVVVKYTIAATEITNHAYTATQKNTEEVKLVVSTDNANYNGYELTLANVYSVTFSYLATHDAETNTAIVKYVFDGQHAASIELPTETGYTFSGWYLLDNETVAENVFDFATTEIKNDITLTGKWTVNTYTVTFKLGNGQDDVTVSVNYGEKIADKIPADPTKAADDYIYTFKYWTLSTDETKAEVNVAEYVVSGDVTFVAEYDQTKNEFTVTLVIKYNDETITTETRVGKLGQTIELPSGIQSKVLKLGKWLYEDETEFDGKITKTATVTATYEIILEKGDVNGDGAVNLDDVVLFRKYLVGGYAIDEIADEDIYTAISAQDAASKTMFFKYSANMDNDANLDIRDVATIRMNVVVTTEGGEEQTETTQSAARMEVVSEAVQYAVLPTNKFVA